MGDGCVDCAGFCHQPLWPQGTSPFSSWDTMESCRWFHIALEILGGRTVDSEDSCQLYVGSRVSADKT